MIYPTPRDTLTDAEERELRAAGWTPVADSIALWRDPFSGNTYDDARAIELCRRDARRVLPQGEAHDVR